MRWPRNGDMGDIFLWLLLIDQWVIAVMLMDRAALELVGPTYRTFITVMTCIFYTLGMLLLAAVAYLVRDWVALCYATSLPFVLFFAYVKWVDHFETFISNFIQEIFLFLFFYTAFFLFSVKWNLFFWNDQTSYISFSSKINYILYPQVQHSEFN